jgi:hypothetical protein
MANSVDDLATWEVKLEPAQKAVHLNNWDEKFNFISPGLRKSKWLQIGLG